MTAVSRPADAPHDDDSPLADPGIRLAAASIDAFATFLPFFLVLPVGIALGSASLIHAGLWLSLAVSLVVLALDAWWLHRYGQTLGKRLLGLRIVLADGARASFGRILVRRILIPGFLGAIPLLGPLFSIVDALFIFSEPRQTIHDRIAGTIVIDLRRGGPPGPTSF